MVNEDSTKIESDMTLVIDEPQTCYVTKIDLIDNSVEIFDTKHAIKARFVGSFALTALKDFVIDQSKEIGISGLRGK